MIVRVKLGHKHLNILGNNILFFSVPEDFTQTHIALVDDTDSFLFTWDVYAGCTILSIVIQIWEIFINIVEFKVDSQIRCLLSLDHLLITCLFVIQDFN